MIPPAAEVQRAVAADEGGLVVTCVHCGQRNRVPYERLGRRARCPACRTRLGFADSLVEISRETIFDVVTARAALPVLFDF